MHEKSEARPLIIIETLSQARILRICDGSLPMSGRRPLEALKHRTLPQLALILRSPRNPLRLVVWLVALRHATCTCSSDSVDFQTDFRRRTLTSDVWPNTSPPDQPTKPLRLSARLRHSDTHTTRQAKQWVPDMAPSSWALPAPARPPSARV
jgi:hypothetical protein